ncbi:hypothetical protein VHUM_00526 [Vanrija humicola]|uniref:Glycoside hydrolase family 71 protein n=1 Tax=Vanrija humicola TaxID=5417 RepID=A0A7D8Z8P7_VANHU|nr:hypothetical protein VHUM_00526 [Vanrija humicola]
MKATFVFGALLALAGSAAASPVERRGLEPRFTIAPNTTSSSDLSSATGSDVTNATASVSVSDIGTSSPTSSALTTSSAILKCRPKTRSTASPSASPTVSPSVSSSNATDVAVPSGVNNGTEPSATGNSTTLEPTVINSAVTPDSTSGEAIPSSGAKNETAIPTPATGASSTGTDATSASSTGTDAPSVSSLSPSPTTFSPDTNTANGSRPDATGAPVPSSSAGSSDKLVFAHFMVGITWDYQPSDWEDDIRKAQSYGIDAFALNIGRDEYNQRQLASGYAAAEKLGFKVFLSFDFNWWKNDQVGEVVQYINEWASKPAQLKVKSNDAAFVSTFIGAGFDWASVKQQVKFPLHILPGNLSPTDSGTQSQLSSGALDGLFSWHAWPGQERNIPVDATLTTDTDKAYQSLVANHGKDYMAPVSPWFFTHFGPEKEYTKNFLFKSEQLWHYRWQQILDLAPEYVEIVTWNDFGESHHIGPYHAHVGDDGSKAYAEALDHTKLMDLAVPFIKAYKAGGKAPVVEKDFVVYWHRPHLKSAECDATDPVKGKPAGWDLVADVVFVAVSSKNGAKVTVTSGSNAPVTLDAQAGIQMFEVPMGTGQQKFELSSGAGTASGTSEIPITAGCWQDKMYNFNFHSGLVSA